ncbi:MAG TPA: hypothetical protein VJO35_05440 [Terriglobales bacterium]|nr:hypothetical protein [Terriglobales bacterium]
MLRLSIWILSQPLFWAIAGTLVGPYLFVRGFRLLQLKRRISNVPRSTIRAAAIGPVEIYGTVTGPYTIIAPMSQSECLYYRLVIESNPHRDLKSKIQEMCAPLYIDDGTGTLMVYPHGSELRLKPSGRRADYLDLALLLGARSRGDLPEFSQEYTIKPGDQIFVLGAIQENLWARKEPSGDPDDCSRIGPGFLSPGEADLERRDAFSLLNPLLPVGAPDKTSEFNLNPPVLMMKGSGPFVISNDSQRDLVNKLSWRSLVYIWGGPIAALWGLWELLVVRPGIVESVLR